MLQGTTHLIVHIQLEYHQTELQLIGLRSPAVKICAGCFKDEQKTLKAPIASRNWATRQTQSAVGRYNPQDTKDPPPDTITPATPPPQCPWVRAKSGTSHRCSTGSGKWNGVRQAIPELDLRRAGTYYPAGGGGVLDLWRCLGRFACDNVAFTWMPGPKGFREELCMVMRGRIIRLTCESPSCFGWSFHFLLSFLPPRPQQHLDMKNYRPVVVRLWTPVRLLFQSLSV